VGNNVIGLRDNDRVLVVAAHPDDEVLGCGGTIGLIAKTHGVHIHIAGEGLTARSDNRAQTGAAALSALHADALQAAGIMGAELSLGGLPDNRFDTLPTLELAKHVEAVIAKVHPTIVFTHFPGDLNVDHRRLFDAVMVATRPMPSSPIREVHCFEVLSSTEWSFGLVNRAFNPQVFYDISTTLEVKVQALAAYRSEVRDYPHPRSLEGVRSSARRWGTVAGVDAAEAFVTVRQVR